MTTENTSPNDAHAAPGAAVDTHSGANGTGAELKPADTGTMLPESAAPEAAHEAALAADALAREAVDDAVPDAMPDAAHVAVFAADAIAHEAVDDPVPDAMPEVAHAALADASAHQADADAVLDAELPAMPEAAHDAAPAADAIAHEAVGDPVPDAMPEVAHDAALAADAPAHPADADAAPDAELPVMPEAAHDAALTADTALHDAASADADSVLAAGGTEATPEAIGAIESAEVEAAEVETAAPLAIEVSNADPVPAEFEMPADPAVFIAADARVEAVAEHVLSANAHVMSESLGQRLRAAREARGMTLEDAAHAMKLPLSTVQSLESDRYERIGEGIYLRSYLAKYLRLLDLPQVLAERVLCVAADLPPLVTSGTISRPRYLYERYSSSALYLILTAVIIVPAVWLAMRAGFDAGSGQITSLDNAESVAGVAARGMVTAPVLPSSGTGTAPERAGQEAPLAASMAPFSAIKHESEAGDASNAAANKPVPAAPAPDGSHLLRLTLPEASWVEIVAADGEKIEFGLLPAGSTRTYRSAKSVDIRLGNASGASFEVDGRAQDLTPYRHANVAHFRLAGNEGTISHSGG